MIAIIKKEETADDEQKAWCDSERETSTSSKTEKIEMISTLEGEIEQLNDDLDNVDTGLKAQKSEEQDTLKQNRADQKACKKTRKEDNMKYQAEISNLLEAEDTLAKAMKV